jgi:ParB family chromosome partitioning protein
MVFAGAAEAVADMAGEAPETEEGDVSAEDSLSDAESDEPSSLPAFLSEDAA